MSKETRESGCVANNTSGDVRNVSGPDSGSGFTRREFLQTSAAVAGLGLSGSLGGCGGSDDDDGNGNETRTYLFDFSRMDTRHHDMVMVAGRKTAKLQEIGTGDLAAFRVEHPILNILPDERVTHWIEIDMPSEGIQLCYVQRVSRLVTDGSWDMAMQFYHFPRAALHASRARELARLSPGEPMQVNVKWGRHGATADQITSFGDPVGEDMYKDSTT
ncbi:MAG: hypothetical protein U9R74_01485, partial [Pseudomonadota bacterium]|nr:hypothetical protein [Pseudomonadota bacterium]